MFRKLSQFFVFPVLILVSLLCLKGCHSLPICMTDEKEVGCLSLELFPYKWWDYYKNALCFEEKGDWKNAEICLEEAIRQRGEDQWDARTYGRHFIDYFPHRELGIVYYLKGEKKDLPLALKKLKASLDYTPSAKTLFYIEKVYADLFEYKEELAKQNNSESKKILSETGLNKIEKKYPTIIPDDRKQKSRENIVKISGYVKDEEYIKSISVNGIPVFLLNSSEDIELYKSLKKEIFFKKQIYLPQGNHTVRVDAMNIMGLPAETDYIKVKVDYLGPALGIRNIRSSYSNDNKAVISGFLSDESKIHSLSINDKEIPIEQTEKAFFTAKVNDNGTPLKLIAYDKIGNQSSVNIPVKKYVDNYIAGLETDFLCQESEKKPTIKITVRKLIVVKEVSDNGPIFKELVLGNDLDESGYVEQKLTNSEEDDIRGYFGRNYVPVEGEKKWVYVELKGSNQKIEAFLNKINIRIEVQTGKNHISDFRLNDIPEIKEDKKDKNRHSYYCYDYVIDLGYIKDKHGGNFIFKLRDDAGKEVIKEITLKRDEINSAELRIIDIMGADSDENLIFVRKKRYSSFEENERLSILVFPFFQKEISSPFLSREFQEKINEELGFTDFTNNKRFYVRSYEYSGYPDPNNSGDIKSALKIGRKRNADFIIVGEIKKDISSQQSPTQIKAAVYNTTEEINLEDDGNIDAYTETSNEDEAVLHLAGHVANKFSVIFPLLLGTVVRPLETDIVTDIAHPKLRTNYGLIVFKPERGEKTANARITRPGYDNSRARIVSDKKELNFKNNRIITQ